jgi:glycopeptide antibiotics resistance protein
MYYIKSKMKNIIFKLLEYSYYFSLIILFVLYLFPGSLIGYFLYGNLSQQPDFISNPIGTSINHLIFFVYLSILGLTVRLRDKNFLNSFSFLFILSVMLELSHWLIPNRAFEYYDLFANSLGVVIAYLLINIFSRLKN